MIHVKRAAKPPLSRNKKARYDGLPDLTGLVAARSRTIKFRPNLCFSLSQVKNEYPEYHEL